MYNHKSFDDIIQKKEKNINLCSYDKINEQKKNIFSTSLNNIVQKKEGFSSSLNSKKSELSSKSESLISWIGKDNEDLEIMVKENNDDLLYIFNKEKIGGESSESIANKTFELICNISLNRNIKVENLIIKILIK